MHVDGINTLTLAISFTNYLPEQFNVSEISMLSVVRGKHSRKHWPVFSSIRIAAFSPWKCYFAHILRLPVEQLSACNEFNDTYFVFAGYLGYFHDHSMIHQGLIMVIRGSLECCPSLLRPQKQNICRVMLEGLKAGGFHTGVSTDLINVLC